MRLTLIIATWLLLLAACKRNETAHGGHTNSDIYYTCSMHPQVVSDKPGDCPICGMALVQARHSTAHKAGEIMLSDEQVQLGNITVDTIRSGSLSQELVLTATLNFDQTSITEISARMAGRIERLYFKNTGDYVQKGQPLFDLYSEELNGAKREYVLALNQLAELGTAMVDYRQLVQAAKSKLLLWGMSEAQIADLAKSKELSNTTTYYSNATGYVATLAVKEGQYVMDGDAVLQLTNLATIWAEAQVYTSQLTRIDRNGKAIIQLPDLNHKEVSGNIEYVNPEISPDTRINLLRVSISNPDGALRPGMPAYVIIRNPARSTISLPIDAVIRDSRGATVWVLTSKNTFSGRMVRTGLESGTRIEIESGLKEGDVVVITGAYLLNSEFVFKTGADPMEGHGMGNL